MDDIKLFQKAVDDLKKETDLRYEKMETLVNTGVEKIHAVAIDLAVIATKLNDVPHARHLEEHDYLQDLIEASKRKAQFWEALTLSLASKFGWKLIIVTILLLIGFIWHDVEIREWVFNEFLKKEVVEAVSK